MGYLDIEKFRSAERVCDPFEFALVPAFVKPERLGDINRDFPPIERAGNFPIEELSCGRQFQAFIEEIKGAAFREAVEDKFDIDLAGLKHVITVRAFSQKSDGNIHTDAPAKVMTALIYLNESWDAPGGQLRLLRNSHDIEDYVAEVPPVAGTLLMFKRSDVSWHGHKPFVGPRRTIQINWVSDQVTASDAYRRGQVRRRVMRWLGLGA